MTKEINEAVGGQMSTHVELEENKDMPILITYVCDKCGNGTNKHKEIFEIHVYLLVPKEVGDGQSGDHVSERLWCLRCVKETGLYTKK